jgi:16S rRNA A1518/A1519 N6-dimethyltransferase RsmA/KsgA/DIM1 with predicted DNA glycosylase/AP lyase activity
MLITIILIIVGCFGLVLLFGAPYLPTLAPQVLAALELAELKAGDHLLELGCGDGKVLLAAAKRGASVTGYELNPLLVVVCRIRCRYYRDKVTVKWGNFWKIDWPEADVIFVFLLPKYMEKLNNKVMQYKHKPVKLLSFAFAIKSKKPTQKLGGVYRYDYR